MATLYHCAGCKSYTAEPIIMINIDESTLHKVSFKDSGRKEIKPIKMVGQYMLCGPKCAALLMLDIFTKDKQEKEAKEENENIST